VILWEDISSRILG